MSGRTIPGGLNLSCTFAEGSQAQSCILTVCTDSTEPEICRSINVSRRDPQTSGHLIGLEPGLYTVREVAEIESDGQVTVHITGFYLLGEAGGKLPPLTAQLPPLNCLPVIVHNFIRLAFLRAQSLNAHAYHTRVEI